jgi:ubiquinone/menaquinone biosynthesis C-methylase UbiE
VTSVEEWKLRIGTNVLKNIGFKSGQIIVDFGCGTGIYDVLLSKIVGPDGKIYAIDSDERGLLSQLLDEIKKLNIQNIKVFKTSGDIYFPVGNKMIDFVLLYDVLHLIDDDKKTLLIQECSRVLKKQGIISYHATHVDSVKDITIKEAHKLMESNGFILLDSFQKPMFHWSWIQDSWIFNYHRKPHHKILNQSL